MNKILIKDKEPSLINQLFNYSLVGIVVNLTGYLIYLIITSLGVPYKLTMSLLISLLLLLVFMAIVVGIKYPELCAGILMEATVV